MFITNRVESAISADLRHELLDDGLFAHADYSIGASLNASELASDNSLGRGSLNNIVEASSRGSYVVAHWEDFERVDMGYVPPASLRFDPVTREVSDDIVLKNVQAREFGRVDNANLTHYETLREDVLPNRSRGVFTEIDAESARDAFARAYMEASEKGIVQ